MQQINIKPPSKDTKAKKEVPKDKPQPQEATPEVVEEGKEPRDFGGKNEEPKSFKTEEVDRNEKGPESQKKTKVNFVNNDFMSGFVKKKTEESKTKEEEAKGATEGKSKEEIAAQIKQEEANPSGGFSKEELMDFAEVFIDILDMLISTGLRFYSGDTSTTAYELPVDKKRKLISSTASV